MHSIIVTGYHRSGTSLTANVLHELGVDMGSNWRKADEANERGYFENMDFVRANQSILEKGVIPDLEKIVEKHKGELWGAKDPRFAETWQYWEPFIESPRFIVCRRRHEAIADSVCFRDNGKYSTVKQKDLEMENIKNYYKSIDLKPRLNVYFERYFTNGKQVRKIADFVGVPYKKVDFVDPNLRHF